MGAMVVTFEKCLDEMVTNDLEDTPGATEAAVEWQELREKQMM
jgi:hypothetical protein